MMRGLELAVVRSPARENVKVKHCVKKGGSVTALIIHRRVIELTGDS
jgi:hypothetical protein